MKISFINDEFSDDIYQCIDFCHKNKIEYIELRKINGTNIANLTAAEISNIAKVLKQNKINVSCIASPFLKWNLSGDANNDFNFKKSHSDQEYLDFLQDVAVEFGTQNIRIFSYLKDVAFDFDHFSNYLHRIDNSLGNSNIKLLLENEHICNISTINDLYCFFNMNSFKNISPLVDLGNSRENIVSVTELKNVAETCHYYHIKDYSNASGGYVSLGQGDIDFEYLIKIAPIDSFLSLETHTGKGVDLENSFFKLKEMLNA
jgi:sugar phosphate isomerase/epimerase